ncbi:MAG: stage II sporulation protein M, partial [Candidatus Undinarchaeales archaeon]|nr:stage II sporulation protein M [Candidatus Undinarchaeales archaeon]
FTAMALVPMIYRVFYIEEGKECEKIQHESLWKRHNEVIMVYLFMFFGMLIAFSFWFTILPSDIINIMFKDQIGEVMRIQNLRTVLVGSLIGIEATGITGQLIRGVNAATAMAVSKVKLLELILANNMRLLFLFVAFSFVFGAGALLLLTWNAAVVGVAIGNLIRQTIATGAGVGAKTAAYFVAFPISFLSFFVHGIFEIVGYFVGAIAGGIFSVAIVRKHYNRPEFKRIAVDVGILLVVAMGLMLIGGVIEVYITPLL